MKAVHYITIAVAIALIALLYLGGNTVPPAKQPEKNKGAQAGAMGQGPNTMKPASFDSLLTASKSQLPKNIADSVNAIENELAAVRDQPLRMAATFLRLSGVWERSGKLPMAAYYKAKHAKLENSEKNLTFAAQIFLQLMEDEPSHQVQMWEAAEAISCLEQSLKIDSTNEDAKLALATAYIEGSGEPMRGVQILRDITAQKPNDIPANMLLGRMSIQSGQFEKAVKRFETVLKQEPNNLEANYFMAQAYEGTGNKEETIKYLEKCKSLSKNPELIKDIDRHISTLK